jgi:hypothetical protein
MLYRKFSTKSQMACRKQEHGKAVMHDVQQALPAVENAIKSLFSWKVTIFVGFNLHFKVMGSLSQHARTVEVDLREA